jgi:hypothetical protein
VRIDGKDFVLADMRRRQNESINSYVSAEISNRELYEFRGDKFVKICEQRPIVTKHIAHEVLPKEEHFRLNYVPVTDE